MSRRKNQESPLAIQLRIHVRVEPRPQGKDVRLFLSLGGKNPAPDVLALVKELQNLLDLDQSVFVYEVVSVPEANNRRQITVQTYSLMQIMLPADPRFKKTALHGRALFQRAGKLMLSSERILNWLDARMHP